jgi:alpha-L-rhamnosidase
MLPVDREVKMEIPGKIVVDVRAERKASVIPRGLLRPGRAGQILVAIIFVLAVKGQPRNELPGSTLKPLALRCEYLQNPLGIDVTHPRLGWVLESREPDERGQKQTAFQILVASSEASLRADQGDLWDSGKTVSEQSAQVVYAGKPLLSRTRCWWKVRVWDNQGRLSAWSAPATWSMGLLNPSDWQGQWIGASTHEQDGYAILLRLPTTLAQRPALATAYVCGLGYYELYLNGKRVGDHVLDPGFTDYDKRVLYVTYDVTDLLRQGANAIGVILGNGWYHPQTPDLFGFDKAPWKRPPRLLLNIEVEFPDGTRQTISSDSSWKWSTGPIVFNCIRGGETYDARLEKPEWNQANYSDSKWNFAVVVPAPKGRLRAQQMPPLRITESVKPVKLTEPRPGIYVFDLGVNLTGWARFEAAGEPGQKITLEFNEVLNPDGTLDTKNSHSHTYGRYQTGELILSRNGKGVFEPRFTYHGFRYVQITGLKRKPSITSLVGFGVHTDWELAGGFSCSNPKINQLQKAVRRTLSNCAHSIPGEEPTREKMGWTQDGLNTMEAAIYNFDAAALYTKYLFDMIDAQEANGHVPPIVPTNGWGRTKPGGAPPDYSDPWWGGTLPYVAEKLYEYYGDRRVIEEAYEPMKRWVDYLGTTANDHLIDWWLGDWLEIGAPGRPKRTPIIQTSTAGYYYCAMAVVRAANLLGKPDDAQKYRRLAEEIKASFNQHFLDDATGLYAKDSQTSQVLSLYLDMAPTRERDLILLRLIEDIHQHKDHMTTGFVGVMPLLHGLVDWGYPDLAYKVAMQEDVPGFLQMIADGNSTLGESLDNISGSRHHPFGACIGSFLFREIAGIRPAAPGFQKIAILPVLGDLAWAKANYDSIHGRIVSEWKREADRFTLNVIVPPNTTATVYLPANATEAITEGGKPINQAPAIELLRVEDGRAIVAIGSGQYSFAANQ